MGIGILGYGCVSAAGEGPDKLWNALVEKKDCSTTPKTGNWPKQVPLQQNYLNKRVCYIPEADTPNGYPASASRLIENLSSAFGQATRGAEVHDAQLRKKRLGIVLASTKGNIDDWVWNTDSRLAQNEDPTRPILEGFVSQHRLDPFLSLTVSNACASSHSAFAIAMRWIEQKRVERVLVLCGDVIGPFVVSGFSCLNALTDKLCTPFGEGRAGLQLGEAAAAFWVTSTSNEKTQTLAEVRGVGLQLEGSSATRPSFSGRALILAAKEASKAGGNPDLVIAHGTGTPLNDDAEDAAFFSLYGNSPQSPAITASKGSIGHTLAASGAIDTIAALECIQRQSIFPITNTQTIDPKFKSRYLLEEKRQPVNSVLATSLGFGGVHAALFLERRNGENYVDRY